MTRTQQLEKELENIRQSLIKDEGYCSEEMNIHIIEIGAELKGRKEATEEMKQKVRETIRKRIGIKPKCISDEAEQMLEELDL